MSQFIHLHLHTQYSILDGAASVKSVISQAKLYGMGAVAITDHGNMFGAKEFHAEAKKAGIKPILGCEVYVVKNRFEKDKDEKAGDHLILLAKNKKGYHNLIKMVSYGWTEGMYYRPRIDKELLRKYSEGIICCSACLGGELPQAIMKGDERLAEEIVAEFKDIFGEDYYMEMQLHRSGEPKRDEYVYKNQLVVNKKIIELAAKTGVKYIASNDVHFTLREDAEAHDRLICLNTGKDLNDPDRMRYSWQEYMKSEQEMRELFPDNPEAITTTLEIANKVEEYELNSKPLMPLFDIPTDFFIAPDELKETLIKKLEKEDAGAVEELEACGSVEEFIAKNPQYEGDLNIAKQYRYLEYLSFEGAKKRYCTAAEELTDEVVDRIRFELGTIEWMGFPGYFLIVWDLIKAARGMGVAVGPGRGSAAGSVVAYCLEITNIDPLAYNLLFERFLNPDRISLPDIDIDFDEDGRAEVLKYVNEKYGHQRVAQIITFGKMAPKMAIRDVARVQGLPLQDSDRLAKLVPDRIVQKDGETAFDRVYKDVPELMQEKNSDNQLIRETLAYAEKLEGSVRQTGVHACGVIIGPDDLENYVPLSTAKDKDSEDKDKTINIVQFDGRHVEDIGLIKMDFLGLKNLSIIKDAVDNIKQIKGIELDIDAIPLDDTATYELYSRGDTTGLFQFESPGMKKHLRNLKPNRFEDLIAMNALYRPGPMGYIPNFIARKHGHEEVVYEAEGLEEYLGDTYGITVYQEQVMLLSQKIGGFTGGEADTLRKAMGKKQREELDQLKPKFLEGAQKNGYKIAVIEKIWSDWEAFAEYAFNKSHSTCYAYISYQTAYLKANYPSEFMAALLSRNLGDLARLGFFMEEAKRMGISVKGPDVNHSIGRFAADTKGDVRFGLAAIKGVGANAVAHIIEERKRGGEYESVYDFVERVNLQTVNKKSLESLVMSGAFDAITDIERGKFFVPFQSLDNETTFIEMLIRYGTRIQTEKNSSQQSLFAGMSEEVEIERPLPPRDGNWTKLELLSREKEMIGMYLSSHPLDDYRVLIDNFCNMALVDLQELTRYREKDFIVAGMVTDVKNLMTKTGRLFGRFTLEDYAGSHEFVLFGKDYEKFRPFLYPDYYLLVKGMVKPRPYNEAELEPKISSIMQLSEAQDSMIKEMRVTIPIEDISRESVEELTRMVGKSKGKVILRVRVIDRENGVSVGLYSRSHKVNVTAELVGYFKQEEYNYRLS